ncbi:MAG: PAS domain S-box protein [Gammaproteobacteria bacterium]
MTDQKSNGNRNGDPISAPDERTFRILVNSVRDYGIFMLDPGGRVVSWNAGAEAIKGYKPEEIIGSHFSRFYPPEALARGLPEHELVTAAQVGRFEDEGWRLKKDGSRFWANVIITALRDEQGKLIGYSKVTRDLSERRRHEQALKESEERFRALIEGVGDYAIFMLDPDGFVSSWNVGAQKINGYEAHEIIGTHFSRFYEAEAVKSGYPAKELRAATLDGRWEDEGWRLRKDGSRLWANVVITAMRDSNGRLIGFSKITRDLTERRRHEDELRKEEERFRLLVDGVTEYAIMMLDKDGFVTSWNAGAQRIKGFTAAEILGKHVSHFYTSEDVASNKPWRDLALARDTGRVMDEGWRLRKDGALFWASTVITALKDAEGKLYGFAKVTQDLTDRRNAESLAETTQRLHEFIAMLAHELRNPLAPIRNAVALMGRKGLADPALESMRRTIDRQSLHLTRLLDELLDVNRVARGHFSIERVSVDLQDVLSRAIETSRPLLDAHAHRFQAAIPDGPIPVSGDAVRLTQAIVNILNNAAKYTPQGGNIRLGVFVRDAEVEIRTVDDGMGIDKSQLEKVFDLFVQVSPETANTLGGLGVGLALVRRIAELHGGSVQARSAGLGRGSEFIVRLPLAMQGVRVVESASPEAIAETPRMRILVVDDNHDAADSMQLLLESMNQDVVTVYDGPAALSAVRTFDPDVVLLDIGMPAMSGYEVARQIAPDGRAITRPILVAITGWGQEGDRQRARECGFRYHFVKPMSESALRSMLIAISQAPAKRP